MKFTWFNLMPWPHLPDDFREKHRSVWVDIPSSLYDPVKGHELYNIYLDELEYAEQLGYDGIGVNEHHANAYGMMPSPNIMAAALARRTSKAALVVLGNSIALYNPPIRVAEEFAMLDVISGGRLLAGFPVGTSMDTNYVYGDIPALTRERYAEAHELIMRAWREPEPFAFNGRYTKLRYANCWPKPVQSPPPIFIPGGGSLETYDFCLDFDYVYCYLSFGGYKRAKQLMDGYWQRVQGSRQGPVAVSRRVRADHRGCGVRRRSRARLSRTHRLLLQPLPARVPRLCRCARLPHDQDAESQRHDADDATGAGRREQHELGSARQRRLCDRRQSRHRGSADEGTDHRLARRQHLLPDPRRQHAERKVHALEQAVRRRSHAATARHVAANTATTIASGFTRSAHKRIDLRRKPSERVE